VHASEKAGADEEMVKSDVAVVIVNDCAAGSDTAVALTVSTGEIGGCAVLSKQLAPWNRLASI
jgi:hypothetical protein